MKPLLTRWLALDSFGDPLRRTQAQLLQRFALILLAGTLLSIPVSLAAQSSVERLAGVITALALLVLVVSSLLLLRSGRLVWAGLLIIIGLTAGTAVNMSPAGLEGSRAIFVLLVLPITLGGLLGDRWLLLAALALSLLVPALMIAGEAAVPGLVGYQPDVYNPLPTFAIFAISAAALALLVGYFGSALQRALRSAIGRERELDALRASLEQQVAERTTQLEGALEHVRAQAAEQAQLLEALEQQRTTIRELSIPILPLNATTLVIPLVGGLDHSRLHDLLAQALAAVERTRARALLLDVTGVPVVDTHVASGIVSVGRAARLLGASVTLIGVRPEVAQTMVALGVDLGDIQTAPDMASVLAGAGVTRADPTPAT